ncbi:MAG TPA: hypothetical protein VNN75_11560, partial [Stellaceae bacterium]|nr:hypothetical protein [Stellaceae bacterium]
MLPWVQSGGGDIGIGYWQRRAIQLKMSYEHILIDAEDGVGIVTLNRPDKLNAMNRQLSSELHDGGETDGGRRGDRLHCHHRRRAQLSFFSLKRARGRVRLKKSKCPAD